MRLCITVTLQQAIPIFAEAFLELELCVLQEMNTSENGKMMVCIQSLQL